MVVPADPNPPALHWNRPTNIFRYMTANQNEATMDKTIWDMKKGDRLKLEDGCLCEVLTPTEDGKGLVVKYLDGDLKGQEDFVFDEEIDFKDQSD